MSPDAKRKKIGRPRDEEKEDAFQKMCSYLELNSEDQLSVTSLRLKMKEFLSDPDSGPYHNWNLKKRLKESFKELIHFSDGEGFGDIVTMREQSSHILR